MVCVAVRIWKSTRDGAWQTPALICTGSFIVALLPAGNAPAYQTGLLTAGLACFCLEQGDARLSAPIITGALVGLAFGEACGSSGVGVYYSGSLAAVAIYSTVLCLFFAVVALAISGLYVVSVIGGALEDAASAASHARPEKTSDRLRLFLASRGLNETQCSVALMTLDGFPRQSIAHKLRLSMGSVNSARAVIYKCFNVHTRSELLDAIDTAMGKKGI